MRTDTHAAPPLAKRRMQTALAALAIGLLLSLLAASPAPAQEEPVREEPPVPLNEEIMNILGDGARPVTLQVTLYLPPGQGPFSLAIVNHGASGRPSEAERYRGNFAAWYFVSRGYAVVMPMMRGFAGSGGVAEIDGCDLGRMGTHNARDLQAVIDYFSHRREIDASRIIMSGQSFGGFNTLAYGAVADPRVKGLISFAGGVDTSACADSEAAMRGAMAEFGRRTHIPSIWLHGDNDARFPPEVWRANYARYTAAGGQAELVAYGVFGKDSHNFLGSGAALPIWIPRVDAFLARIGLPNQELYPAYLPLEPAKTNYADVEDVDAVPFLGAKGKDLYRKFLATPLPRAFIISPQFMGVQNAGFDPVARGLRECAKASSNCAVYAFENDVVWTGPPAGATLTHAGMPIQSKTIPAGAASVISNAAFLKPDCSTTTPPEAAIALSPAHGAARIVLREGLAHFAASSPLAACNNVKTQLLMVEYTPEPGFTGVDFVGYRLTRDAETNTIKIAVTVKGSAPALPPSVEGPGH